MDWQAALRARLIAAAPLTALVGQRVYWVDRPQGSALPAVTLQTVADARNQHLKGFDSIQPARVQIDIWALNYATARSVAEAVLAAAIPAATQGGVKFARAMVELPPRDLIERTDTQTIFRVSTDLIFHRAFDEGA